VTAKIQHFPVSRGNTTSLFFDVNPDDGVSIVGADITWMVYPQAFGVPDTSTVLIFKSVNHGGIVITDPDQLLFTVFLDPADTDALIGNYYHEATILPRDGEVVTCTVGIMTVTNTGAPNG